MKFLKKDDGFGEKEVQKQLRLSVANNLTLKYLSKMYNRPEADLINELLYFETKKIAFLEKIKEVFEQKGSCQIASKVGEFIGFFPERVEKPGMWNQYTIENRLGYQFIKIVINKSMSSSYKYFLEYTKHINIYSSLDKYPTNPLVSNYFIGSRNIEGVKELLNVLEELNIDIYSVDIVPHNVVE